MKFLHWYRYLAIKERMRDWIRIRSSDFLPTETHAQHHFLVCRTEQQFHPEIYKSTKCNDIQNTSYCPRGAFCAFAHVERKSFIYININMLPAFERLLQNVFACIFIQIFETVQHYFQLKACKESKKSKVKVKFSKSNFFFNIQTVFYSVFKIILSLLFVSFV